MVHFKHLQLGKEAATLIASGILTCAMTTNTLKFSLPCRAVPSQHGWISWAKLAWFGTHQLGTMTVYTGKSKRTIPCPAASVNALLYMCLSQLVVHYSWTIVTNIVITLNSMGSRELLDKYHSCCIGNGKFHLAILIQHLWYLSQISLLPTLLLVYTHI